MVTSRVLYFVILSLYLASQNFFITGHTLIHLIDLLRWVTSPLFTVRANSQFKHISFAFLNVRPLAIKCFVCNDLITSYHIYFFLLPETWLSDGDGCECFYRHCVDKCEDFYYFSLIRLQLLGLQLSHPSQALPDLCYRTPCTLLTFK